MATQYKIYRFICVKCGILRTSWPTRSNTASYSRLIPSRRHINYNTTGRRLPRAYDDEAEFGMLKQKLLLVGWIFLKISYTLCPRKNYNPVFLYTLR